MRPGQCNVIQDGIAIDIIYAVRPYTPRLTHKILT